MQIAITKAGTHPFTLKPGNKRSASLIIMADTKSLTRKDTNPSVRIFKGSRKATPIVALSKPITNATQMAVP
mgnify:CR=1 FL=1